MKKRDAASIGIGVICLLIGMFGLWDTVEPSEEQPSQAAMGDVTPRTVYRIRAHYDDDTQIIHGKMQVEVSNGGNEPWQDMYFHLFPNAFWDWEFKKAAAPKTKGKIDVIDVSINGTDVQPQVEKTLMKIEMPTPLLPYQKAFVEMSFNVQIPSGAMRLNHVEHTVFLAQWYPMLAVHDDEGWHTDPYTAIGDPFYTQMADYTVTFEVPPGYRVISTADDRKNAYDTTSTVTVSQQNVRDFAAVITKDYERKTGRVGKTKVNVWYRNSMVDVVDELFAAATNGLEFFNRNFGTYPYPEVDVVLGETGHGIAGMEYPGLVTSLDRIVTQEGEEPAIHVVVHELAHQWWYAVVGNNQVKEPWLDEGLTTFSESLYMSEVEGRPERQRYEQAAARSDQVHDQKGLTVVQPVYDYPEPLYALMVYARPAAMMWELSDKIGQDKVVEILKVYYKRFRNQIATTEDFIQVACDVSGEDLRPFFDEWLYFRRD